MKVEALPQEGKKYVGYYNLVRRKAGDVFNLLAEKDFSATWMKKVPEKTQATAAPGEPTPEEVAELRPDLMNESQGRGPGRPRKS